jgi:hypothetical protein
LGDEAFNERGFHAVNHDGHGIDQHKTTLISGLFDILQLKLDNPHSRNVTGCDLIP